MQVRKRKQPPVDGPTTEQHSRSRSHTVSSSVRGGVAAAGSTTSSKTVVLENGKRRVRKGTKSCWQCRRRKIKCEYKATGDLVCIRCTEKGEICRSQEYPEHPGPDEPAAATAAGTTASSTRTVHQRLADMERALQLVVNAVGPNAGLFRGVGRPRAKRVGGGGSSSVTGERLGSVMSGGMSPVTGERLGSVMGDSMGSVMDADVDSEDSMQDDHDDDDQDDDDDDHDQDDHEPVKEDTTALRCNQTTTPNPCSAPAPAPASAPTPAPARHVLAWQHALPSPPDTEASRAATSYALPATLPRSQKLDMLRTKLLPLFPPQDDINRIFENSSGVYFIVLSLFPLEHIEAARVPSIQDMKTVPPPTAHPLCMAKKLLQLAVIIQHLEPSLDRTELSVKRPLSALTDEWYAAVSLLVTGDDDMLGSLEGLECLLLQCLYMANVGSLRKAWIICRRAISFAQLMGLGQGLGLGLGAGSAAAPRFMVPSVDTETDATWKPTPAHMWYRLNFFDRYTSLLLGLPAATQDASFARPEVLRNMSATARLERILTVASARISERNTLRPPQNARDMTLTIYAQITDAGAQMDRDWWQLPDLAAVPFTPYALQLSFQVMVQMHYFILIIILHLPYMMKGTTAEQRDYSKSRCLEASREVLSRFCNMRRSSMSSMSCRHVDYTALVGSMTLLLSYLDQRPVTTKKKKTKREKKTHDGEEEGEEEDDDDEEGETTCEIKGTHRTTSPLDQQVRDRHMVVTTQKLLNAMAEKNNDRLTGEAANIVSQLLPIIDNGGEASAGGVCRINVPYLGVVTLRMRSGGEGDGGGAAATAVGSMATGSVDTASSAVVSTATATATATDTAPLPQPTDFHLSNIPMPEPEPSNNLPEPNIPEAMAFSDLSDLFSLDPNFTPLDMRGFEGSNFNMLPPGSMSTAATTATAAATVPIAHASVEHLLYSQPPGAGSVAAAVAEGLPGITADAGRWAFQGVDTNYWTLLGQPFGEDLMMMVQGEGRE